MKVVLVAASLAAAVASVASANFYSGLGGAIPDNSPAGAAFTINVGDAGQVGTFNGITLTGLTHTWAGDLVISLVLPDATTVSIANRIGKTSSVSGFGESSNFGGNYTFNDTGADIWAAGLGGGSDFIIPSGAYRATGALVSTPIDLNALIAGKDITGDWKLIIVDAAGGDIGALVEWSLDFSVVPAPGAMALLGLAGVVGGRRRRS